MVAGLRHVIRHMFQSQSRSFEPVPFNLYCISLRCYSIINYSHTAIDYGIGQDYDKKEQQNLLMLGILNNIILLPIIRQQLDVLTIIAASITSIKIEM